MRPPVARIRSGSEMTVARLQRRRSLRLSLWNPQLRPALGVHAGTGVHRHDRGRRRARSGLLVELDSVRSPSHRQLRLSERGCFPGLRLGGHPGQRVLGRRRGGTICRHVPLALGRRRAVAAGGIGTPAARSHQPRRFLAVASASATRESARHQDGTAQLCARMLAVMSKQMDDALLGLRRGKSALTAAPFVPKRLPLVTATAALHQNGGERLGHLDHNSEQKKSARVPSERCGSVLAGGPFGTRSRCGATRGRFVDHD
jgi:hypothetical protein